MRSGTVLPLRAHRGRFAAFVLVLGLGASACGGGSNTASGGVCGPDTERPSSPATVRIIEPKQGAVAERGTLEVEVAVDGGRILRRATTELRPDTGHIHIRVDDRTLTQFAGKRYTADLSDLPPGDKLLTAEYAAADHVSFCPPVVAFVTVKVP